MMIRVCKKKKRKKIVMHTLSKRSDYWLSPPSCPYPDDNLRNTRDKSIVVDCHWCPWPPMTVTICSANLQLRCVCMDTYPPRFVLVQNISSVVEYARFFQLEVATFATKVGFVCLGVSGWIFASEQVLLDVLELFHRSFLSKWLQGTRYYTRYRCTCQKFRDVTYLRARARSHR